MRIIDNTQIDFDDFSRIFFCNFNDEVYMNGVKELIDN